MLLYLRKNTFRDRIRTKTDNSIKNHIFQKNTTVFDTRKEEHTAALKNIRQAVREIDGAENHQIIITLDSETEASHMDAGSLSVALRLPAFLSAAKRRKWPFPFKTLPYEK